MEPRGQIKQTGQPCDEVSFEDLAKRTKGLVIVLMPTYNGHPAKNAAAFCSMAPASGLDAPLYSPRTLSDPSVRRMQSRMPA